VVLVVVPATPVLVISSPELVPVLAEVKVSAEVPESKATVPPLI